MAGSSGHKLLLPQWRADQPPVRKRQRASLTDALLAGEPSERTQALAELDQEVLSKTTIGPYESRLLVWRRICAKWDVPAFPLDDRNVRAVAASLKRGRYRSSEQYFSAAAAHQARRLHMTVPPHIRSIIRDCVRSIRRGLGPSALKDSFDLRCLAPSVLEGSGLFMVQFASCCGCIVGCSLLLHARDRDGFSFVITLGFSGRPFEYASPCPQEFVAG